VVRECGRRSLKRGAETIGADFSEEAVMLASIIVPEGRFQQGDAQALRFPDASFDAAVCGYGLMHVPDPDLALHEVVRVLRPGGRASFSVWDANGVGFTLVYEAVRNSDRQERMQGALNEAGFTETAAYSLDQEWTVPDADGYIEAILTGTVRAAAVFAAQSPEARTGVRTYIVEFLSRLQMAASNPRVPMPAIIGSGKRPAKSGSYGLKGRRRFRREGVVPCSAGGCRLSEPSADTQPRWWIPPFVPQCGPREWNSRGGRQRASGSLQRRVDIRQWQIVKGRLRISGSRPGR